MKYPVEVCPHCKSGDYLRHVLVVDGPHYAKLVCDDCDERFITWIPKPDPLKTKRPAKHRRIVSTFKAEGVDYCQMCLRHESELPGTQVLEGHHVIEFTDGGTAERLNTWLLCTPCHSFVHHQRTYLGHYHRRDEGEAAA